MDSISCKSDPTPDKRHVVHLYLAFQFCFDLLIWLPVFYEFQREIGLSEEQILGIQSLHYLAFVIFEIPTGYLADRFGYQHSLRWGGFLFFLCNLFPIFWQNATGMTIHFVMIALSRSLISGAASAYIYEFLKQHNASHEYKSAEGQARSFSLMGRVASWFVVGTLMNWHITLPYWITAGVGFLSWMLAKRLPQLPWEAHLESVKTKWAQRLSLMPVLRELMHSPLLFLIMLQGLVIFVFGRLQVTYFQPVLAGKNFSITDFGEIMALMTVFEATASYLGGRYKKIITDLNTVYLLSAVITLSFLGIAIFDHQGAVVGFCIFATAMGFAYPVQRQLLNDHIRDSRQRATLLSIESMLDRSLSALAIMVFTGLASHKSFDKIFAVSAFSGGALIVVIAILIGMAKRRGQAGHP